MQVYLEVVDGPMTGRRKVIRPSSVLTVGRTENADFAIPGDERMSSMHLRFECSHDSCCVHDLNSSNGTWVNDQPINERSLADGDRITAGQTTFRIHIESVTKSISSKPDRNTDTSEETVSSASSSGQLAQTPLLPQGKTGTVVDDEKWLGAILEINSGNHSGRKIWVRKTQLIRIGRADTTDQAINDDSQLSSAHFSIEFEQASWQIRDLNSTNGTYVNGQRVTIAVLNDGDCILAGATTFVARIGGDDLQGTTSSTPLFEAALADEDSMIRREALYAALWTRQPWLLDYCRQKASEPVSENIDELRLLAILGTSSDLQLIRKIGEAGELGETRYEIVGSYGHPELMDDILLGIDSKDVVTAESAARAFSRITALEVEYVEDEVKSLLPDKQKAQATWESAKVKYSRGTRWCRGHDVSKGATEAIANALDMLAQRELRLRGKYDGNWQGNLSDLERFPIPD